MTFENHSVVEKLIERASRGDQAARDQLFQQYRSRLKKMVAVRMDARLSARFDPSDVVQETLIIASQRIDSYLAEQPLPFYPWLRQIAWERLIHLHDRHLATKKRSVTQEARVGTVLSDESIQLLVGRITTGESSPSRQLLGKERRRRVSEALQRLTDRDREVLALRFLEELSIREVASILSITESAVQMRQLRALERLRDYLEE